MVYPNWFPDCYEEFIRIGFRVVTLPTTLERFQSDFKEHIKFY